MVLFALISLFYAFCISSTSFTHIFSCAARFYSFLSSPTRKFCILTVFHVFVLHPFCSYTPMGQSGKKLSTRKCACAACGESKAFVSLYRPTQSRESAKNPSKFQQSENVFHVGRNCCGESFSPKPSEHSHTPARLKVCRM